MSKRQYTYWEAKRCQARWSLKLSWFLKVVLVSLGACLVNLPATAQEKTPANAFEFIRMAVTDGSWTGTYEDCFPMYDVDGSYMWDTCADESTPITSVVYLDNTYCAITFQMRPLGETLGRTIDFRKHFEVYQSGGINFDGPVTITNGEIRSSWRMETTNWDATTRVTAALQYLREVCKPDTGPW